MTRAISEYEDLATIADIGLVFNVSETGQDLSITLEDLYFTVFNTDGIEIFSAFLLADSETVTKGTGTGTGGSGFLYILDDLQRADAIAAEVGAGGLNEDWRVGGGFLATDFNDGNETVFTFNAPGGDVPPDVPEPSSMLLFGGGLLGLAYWRRRKNS